MPTASKLTSAPALRALLHAVLAASVPVGLVACGGATSDDAPAGDGGKAGDVGYQCEPQTSTVIVSYTAPPRCDAGASDADVLDAQADALDAQADVLDAGIPCSDRETVDCLRACANAGNFSSFDDCRLLSGQPGKVECTTHQYCGRRPAGLLPLHHRETGLAAYLTEGAHLEAASIEAFHILARELALHDAPSSLVLAAKQAARDEARHARVMFALARREGAATTRVRAKALRGLPRARELEDVAIENAIEGCVRESYGALLALRQTKQTKNPKIHETIIKITKNKITHVARWASRRLSPSATKRVRRARAAAIRDLEREASAAVDPETARAAGLPDPAEALALVRGLGVALENYSAG